MFAYVEKDKDYFDFMVLSQLNMDNLFKQPTDFNVEYMFDTPEYPVGVYVLFKGITKAELCDVYNKQYGKSLVALPVMNHMDFNMEQHGDEFDFMDWIDSFGSQLIIIE